MKNQRNNIYSSLSPKKLIIILVVFILVVILFFSCFSPKKSGGKVALDPDVFIEATVTKIVDGDTFWVTWTGGSDKVRLIGIDSPEMDYYASEKTEGDLALDYLNSIIKVDQVVYLQTDVSDEDDYNRLLRYVWLSQPKDKDNEGEIKTKMVNALVILKGFAVAKEYEPDIKYSKLFKKFQTQAQKDKVGVWQEDATE